MDDILDKLSNPITCKGDEHDQSDDLCAGTAAVGTSWIRPMIVGLVLDVDRYQGDGKPGSKGQGGESSKGANREDVTVSFGDIHSGLQHEDGEGYPWDP